MSAEPTSLRLSLASKRGSRILLLTLLFPKRNRHGSLVADLACARRILEFQERISQAELCDTES